MLALADLALRTLLTAPPPLPSYAQVRAAWRPSEAWLYDRHGAADRLARGSISRARRLAWTPLDAGRAGRCATTVVAAEDRRFAQPRRRRLAGARRRGARPAAQGGAARGASTLIDAGRRPISRPISRGPGARGWRDKLRQMRAGAGARGGAGARTRSSKPISTSPASAARRRGSARRRWGCSARRPRRCRATTRCCSPRCCPTRRPSAAAVARARLPRWRGERDCARFAGAGRRRCSARRAALALDPGPRAAPRRPAADQARRCGSRTTLDARRPAARRRRAAAPAARARRRRARATARWWWSTMPAATCSPMSAGSAAHRPRRRSTARTPIARRDRR